MVKRVLLADDDADDRMLFEEVFSALPQHEYKLESVDNGQEVLQFLKSINDNTLFPSLIVLDQNMPLMSGKETLMALKDSLVYRHIPVIIYSTYNDKNFIAECQKLGVNGVVSKPDSYEGYTTMIHKFILEAL